MIVRDKNKLIGATDASVGIESTPCLREEESRTVDLVYHDKNALRKAYFHFVKGGGIFFSGSQSYDMKEVIFLKVLLPDDQIPLVVQTSVVWIDQSDLLDESGQRTGVKLEGSAGLLLQNRIEKLLDNADLDP